MEVDIYIKERNGSREIRIPWLPESIKIKEGEVITAEYKVIGRGNVAVPTGTGLATYSWESVWPGENRKDNSLQIGRWQDPKTYHNTIKDWSEEGTALNVLVTGYPINKNVYVKKYEAEATGGFGDMAYGIELEEQRDLIITTKKVKIVQPQPVRPAPKTTSYTIKKGDTLWAIARRFLGNATQWPTIYKANKAIIEATAKARGRRSSSNGHWIYPGVTIQIPG